jgi:hypothetical protein
MIVLFILGKTTKIGFHFPSFQVETKSQTNSICKTSSALGQKAPTPFLKA